MAALSTECFIINPNRLPTNFTCLQSCYNGDASLHTWQAFSKERITKVVLYRTFSKGLITDSMVSDPHHLLTQRG